MKQTFHKFRAATLDQAYLTMRSALGDDAIVVRTATVPEGGWLGRLLGQTAVEVTASVSTETPVMVQRSVSPLERRYRETASATRRSAIGIRPETAAVGSDERVRDTVGFFRELVSDAQRRAGIHVREPQAPSPAPTGVATPPVETGNTAPAEVIPFETPERPEAPVQSMDDLRENISEMRDMLNIMSAEMPGAGLPQEFVPHYQSLLKHGVTRKRAASLVKTAASRGDLRAFRDARIFLERLKMEIRRDIRVTGGIALEAGRRKVVAFVGATGVGKTTNLAKIAALYAVQEHAKVGVITTDTYRVAATDQLQLYANIIDLDMRIVHEPAEMKEALKSFADCDLVLIDTAGGSPFNREQMKDMRGLLDVAQPDEVHLLAGANTSLEDLRDVVTHFSLLRPTAVFFTKLDETRRYGPLYCLAAEAGLPVSYFSIGQNVPDDILPANPGIVAKLVVEGGDGFDESSAQSS